MTFGELWKNLEEVVVIFLKVPSRNLLGWTEKNHDKHEDSCAPIEIRTGTSRIEFKHDKNGGFQCSMTKKFVQGLYRENLQMSTRPRW